MKRFSIYSADIIHEHPRLRRIVSHRCNAQKHARVKWCRDMMLSVRQARLMAFTTSLQMIILGFINTILKRSRRFGCFKTKQRLSKLNDRGGVEKILIATFFTLTVWCQFHNDELRPMLYVILSNDCQKCSLV